jgi:hypothetical protein
MSNPQGDEYPQYAARPDQQYQAPGGPWPSPGYPPPGYQPPGYQQPVVVYQQLPPKRPTDGLAIASMVLGIVWVYWIGSILAVIFGHVALRRIAREGKAGRGMAIAGLVLGYIGIATLAFVILAAIVGAHSGGS